MTQSIFIGVDGGATKSIVRVENEEGQLLGREVSGPASIRISVVQAWQSIYAALEKILSSLNIRLHDENYQFYAGMGLAGCEITSAYQAFIQEPHLFKKLTVSSDSHAACLGAHGGKDGAIIIIGTGVVGLQIEAAQMVKIGGWGFPHDDEGGGAWLGLHAVKITLHWLDQRLPVSGLAKAVYAYFAYDQTQLVNWANQANSTAFAELAPIVIQQSQAGDPTAVQLMQQAANAIHHIGMVLAQRQQAPKKTLPCALAGGISSYIRPYLPSSLSERIHPCQSPPDAGALLLVRHYKV